MRRGALLVALAGALLAAPAQAPASSTATRLLHAGCPHTFAIGLRHFGPHRIRQAKRGIAEILNKRRKLDPPIDWHQNPFHSYPWQKKLNELEWLDPLIYADLHGSHRALRRALAVVLDWVHQNPVADPQGFGTAWERKRAGDRLSRIAFVTRRAACKGKLSHGKAQALVTSVERHAAFLLAAGDGQEVTNHGLLRDQGLLVAARYFPFDPHADHWRSVAVHRFEHGIHALVDRRTGVHLEHTPGYQQKTIEHLEVFLGLVHHREPALQRLLRRMKRADAWFTMPDGDIVPIADTPFYKPAPGQARHQSHDLHGLSRYLIDGFAIARRAGSYLATVAGFHRDAHKHADELTFDLFERGRRVIVDSGRRDHTQVPTKSRNLPGPRTTAAWTMSSFAHSTLVVDGRSFPLGGHPYGSALDAEGSGDGWFAILGHNPLVRSQGVRHQRLLLYRPGHVVVIADRIRAKGRHTYSRYLQIGPGIAAKRRDGAVQLRAHGFRGSIWSSRGRAHLYRGSLHPLRGWYVRGGFHSLTPRFTERLKTGGRDERLITTVGIGAAPVKAHAVSRHSYLVRSRGEVPVKLTVHRQGRHLHVSAGKP